jgi:hypothetical protein
MQARMDREGARYMDVRKEVQDTFNATLKTRMAKTVWATGCKSWYLDEQGRNPSLWPSFTFRFKQETLRLKPQDYEFARASATGRVA